MTGVRRHNAAAAVAPGVPGAAQRLRRAASAIALIAAAMAAGVPIDAAAGPDARAIRIGAGEHDGFSRVVLNDGPIAGWRASSVGRVFVLDLPRDDWRFDLDAIRKHRRAHRVRDVDVVQRDGRTRLTFDLTCDCAARVRPTSGGLLVVDFQARAEQSDVASEGKAGGATDAATRRAEDAGDIETANTPSLTAPLDVEGARAFLLDQLQRAADQGLIEFKDESRNRATAPNLASQTPPNDGAEQTGVSPRTPPADPQTANPQASAPQPTVPQEQNPRQRDTQTPDAQKLDAPQPDTPAVPSAAAASGVTMTPPVAAPAPPPARAETPGRAAEAEKQTQPQGRDLARAQARPQPPAPARPADTPLAQEAGDARPTGAAQDAETTVGEIVDVACPADAALDPSGWVIDAPYFDALSDVRAVLINSLNRVEPDAAAGLQKLYLSQGFGLEAANVPAAFNLEDDATVRLLGEIGAVVARRVPAAGTVFNRRAACPGRHAFWQAAALAESDPARAVASARLSGASLLTTPAPLRRMLGARIALAAAKVGDVEVAERFLAILERSQRPPTPVMQLAQAELAIRQGRLIAAGETLNAISRTNDPTALEAALRLSEILEPPYDAGRAHDVADVLAEYALRTRLTPTLIDVVDAEARLRTRFGRLELALQAVDVARRYGRADHRAALDDLRLTLLEDTVAGVGSEKAFEPFKAYDLSRDAGPPPMSQQALERAAQAIEAVRRLGAGPRQDALRVALAERMRQLGAPHVAKLLISRALAAENDAAFEARAAAAKESALLDPIQGAPITAQQQRLHEIAKFFGAEEPSASTAADGGAGLDLDRVETADAELSAAVEAAGAGPAGAPPDTPGQALRRLTDAEADLDPAVTIEDGQDVLGGVAEDIAVIRSLTRSLEPPPPPPGLGGPPAGESP